MTRVSFAAAQTIAVAGAVSLAAAACLGLAGLVSPGARAWLNGEAAGVVVIPVALNAFVWLFASRWAARQILRTDPAISREDRSFWKAALVFLRPLPAPFFLLSREYPDQWDITDIGACRTLEP